MLLAPSVAPRVALIPVVPCQRTKTRFRKPRKLRKEDEMRKPFAILTLISMLFAVPIARADDHLVTRGAVNQRLADAATERARNLASVDGVLASPPPLKPPPIPAAHITPAPPPPPR